MDLWQQRNVSAFYFIFILFFLFVVNFVIHWNETTMGLHVFPIPMPPPTSLSLLFNMLPRFLIAFLPRSKWLLISWLQSLSSVILKLKKIKSVTVSIVSPSICCEAMGPDAMILVFWMLSVKKPAFSLSSFTFIKRFFSSSSFSAIKVVLSAYLRLLIFLFRMCALTQSSFWQWLLNVFPICPYVPTKTD